MILCVILASEDYLRSFWTNHERQYAVARAMREKGREYILPVRVDPVDLPGVPPTIGYASLDDGHPIERIGQMLIAKLRAAPTE